MQQTIDKTLDGLTLSAELDSIAAGINSVFIYLKEWDSPDRVYDQPSADTLAETLFGLERHLLRVSEDCLTYIGILEAQMKEITGSNAAGVLDTLQNAER